MNRPDELLYTSHVTDHPLIAMVTDNFAPPPRYLPLALIQHEGVIFISFEVATDAGRERRSQQWHYAGEFCEADCHE